MTLNLLDKKLIISKFHNKLTDVVITQYQEYLVWDDSSATFLYKTQPKLGESVLCYLKEQTDVVACP